MAKDSSPSLSKLEIKTQSGTESETRTQIRVPKDESQALIKYALVYVNVNIKSNIAYYNKKECFHYTVHRKNIDISYNKSSQIPNNYILNDNQESRMKSRELLRPLETINTYLKIDKPKNKCFFYSTLTILGIILLVFNIVSLSGVKNNALRLGIERKSYDLKIMDYFPYYFINFIFKAKSNQEQINILQNKVKQLNDEQENLKREQKYFNTRNEFTLTRQEEIANHFKQLIELFDKKESFNKNYLNDTLYLFKMDLMKFFYPQRVMRADYASEANGGKILFTKCTLPFEVNTRWLSFFNYPTPIKYNLPNPRIIIQVFFSINNHILTLNNI